VLSARTIVPTAVIKDVQALDSRVDRIEAQEMAEIAALHFWAIEHERPSKLVGQ
jgi:hypothetical protein